MAYSTRTEMKNKDPGFGFEVNKPYLETQGMYKIKRVILIILPEQL